MRALHTLILALGLGLIPTTGHLLLVVFPLDDAHVYSDFHSITLFLVDAALLGSTLLALLRLREPSWRERFFAVLDGGLGDWRVRAWLGLLAWAALSALWAIFPLLSLYQTAHLALSVLLLLTIAALQDNARQRLEMALVIAGGFYSLIAIAQVLHGERLGLDVLGEMYIPMQRGAALSVNPNNLAGYLLLALVSSARLSGMQPQRAWWWRGLGALLLLGLLMTGSRAALLGLGAGLLLVALHRGSNRRGFWLLLAFVGLAIGLRFAMDEKAASDLVQRLTYEFPRTLTAIQESPLVGHGMGNVLPAIYEATGERLALLLPAHNSFVVVWAELGLPGTALYAAALLTALGAAWRRRHDPRVRFLLAGLLAVLVISMLDYYWWSDLRSRVLLMIMLGLLLAEAESSG